MIRWIFLLGLAWSVSGISISFIDCGGINSYVVEDVVLDAKCSKEPCPLPLKTYTNTTISFRSNNVTAKDLKPKSYFTVANHNQTIDVAPILCPVHVCPVVANEHKKFSVLLMPKFIGPNYAAYVYLELYNQNNKQVVCAYFKALICEPDKSLYCKSKNM